MNYRTFKNRKRALIKEHGCKCAYCGKQMTRRGATLDHVVPRCMGGTHDLQNLKLACVDCNQRKADKSPHIWFAELMQPGAAA